MAKVEIKRESSSEQNVSQRSVTYDVYVDGKYHSTYKDIVEAMDAKEKLEGGKTQNSSPFQTGAARAEQAITNKAASVGVRVGNKRYYSLNEWKSAAQSWGLKIIDLGHGDYEARDIKGNVCGTWDDAITSGWCN